MAHNAAPSTATETAGRFSRWTQAKTGKGPELKFIQNGRMPMTRKRYGPIKRVK